MFNLIVRLVRDPALAEDVAQDTFLKTYRSLARFDTARRFSGWIFRIANNAALDALRRKKIDPLAHAAEAEPAIPPPPDQVEASALAAAISAALDSLRADWRAAVVLRYQEGLSYEDIAEALNIPEGTAKTFVHRARKQLADTLAAAGWQP